MEYDELIKKIDAALDKYEEATVDLYVELRKISEECSTEDKNKAAAYIAVRASLVLDSADVKAEAIYANN